mgnify:CR=1 FL=1
MPRRSARLAAQAAAAACPLLLLSDDVLEVVGHQIADALRPAVAGALAACNHNLWRVMRAPLTKLQPRHAAARALAAKVRSSCAGLSAAASPRWDRCPDPPRGQTPPNSTFWRTELSRYTD